MKKLRWLLMLLGLFTSFVPAQTIYAKSESPETFTIEVYFSGYNSDPENSIGCEVNLCAISVDGVDPSAFLSTVRYGSTEESITWKEVKTYPPRPRRWTAYLNTDLVNQASTIGLVCTHEVICVVTHIEQFCMSWTYNGVSTIRRVRPDEHTCLALLPLIGGKFAN